MTKKVLFLNRSHSVLPTTLSKAGFEIEEDLKSDLTALSHKLPAYEGIVLRSRVSLPATVLRAAPQLRFIAREGVGTEHIDVVTAAKLGIEVLTSPEGSRDTVGEHALGLLLALMNNLCRADQEIRSGIWQREPNRGVEIKGKTVGIIGYGNMGQSFARKISGLEPARVLAYDKFRQQYSDDYAAATDLPTLQQQADIISIHIPYSAENEYFINENFLKKCDKQPWIINTARGLVLKTAALVAALRTSQIKGAALDVIEYEDQSFEQDSFGDIPDWQYLTSSDKVVLSPHIAGWSVESKRKHAAVLANKILALYE